MKIVKLPAEYVRYLYEGYHVTYGNYEYWMYIKSFNGSGWKTGFKRCSLRNDTVEEVKIV